MKVLIIGGTYDDNGGKQSGFVNKFVECFRNKNSNVTYHSHGYYSNLEQHLSTVVDYDVVFWFANISNDKPKLLNRIKQLNSKVLLISSKNNLNGNYQRLELISRALVSKSNLLFEIGSYDGKFCVTIMDPLNNVFINRETDIEKVVEVSYTRICELIKFTRIPSRQVGEKIVCPTETNFFEIARENANNFHHLVHAVNQDRFLGNLSFRCENGFPSFRKNDLIFVSQRNIDKRNLNENGFVAVNLNSENCVEYYGSNKPSVDTPIQIRLYNYYHNIKYMLHAHVYVDDTPTTHDIIPCGSIEEFTEIMSLFPNRDEARFCVNLNGHGCLILTDNVEYLRDVKYKSR